MMAMDARMTNTFRATVVPKRLWLFAGWSLLGPHLVARIVTTEQHAPSPMTGFAVAVPWTTSSGPLWGTSTRRAYAA